MPQYFPCKFRHFSRKFLECSISGDDVETNPNQKNWFDVSMLDPCLPSYQTIFHLLIFFWYPSKTFLRASCCSEVQKTWHLTIYTTYETWTEMPDYIDFCLCFSSRYSFVFFWPILVSCLLCLTSSTRLLLKSPCLFSTTSQFYYSSYSSQILVPCLLAWTPQRWVITFWLLLCFQFPSSEKLQIWTKPWAREAC